MEQKIWDEVNKELLKDMDNWRISYEKKHSELDMKNYKDYSKMNSAQTKKFRKRIESQIKQLMEVNYGKHKRTKT